VGRIPRAKGGVKAPVLLDHDDYRPRYVTEGRRSDVKMAGAFPLNPGSIVAMDRGYNASGWITRSVHRRFCRNLSNLLFVLLDEDRLPPPRWRPQTEIADFLLSRLLLSADLSTLCRVLDSSDKEYAQLTPDLPQLRSQDFSPPKNHPSRRFASYP
jgi:hypothetical protein